MFRKNRKFELNSLESAQMRVLTDAEIALVSGGDDGSCSAGGDCSSSSASDSGAVGTLATVTVTESIGAGAAVGAGGGLLGYVAGATGALTVGDAIAVGTTFGGAIGALSAFITAGIGLALNSIPPNSGIPALGNAMGDPDGTPASGP